VQLHQSIRGLIPPGVDDAVPTQMHSWRPNLTLSTKAIGGLIPFGVDDSVPVQMSRWTPSLTFSTLLFALLVKQAQSPIPVSDLRPQTRRWAKSGSCGKYGSFPRQILPT
jgi:hypothetical protein